MKLRPYQRAAIDTTHNFLRHRDGNPCIVLPVGSGKSVVMGAFTQEAVTEYPGTRIAILAHVRELVRQNHEKLITLWPNAPAGIFSASLGRKDRFDPIIFGSIQSVYDKAPKLGRFDLLLIDEAHRIPIKDEGMYRHFIEQCTRFNPDLRTIGLTATPFRLGGGPVCSPVNVLTDISYEEPIKDLINNGYLTLPVSKPGATRADLSEVHIRQGEYVEDELGAAMMKGDLVKRACKEIAELCDDRRAWIIFASSVAHAYSIHETLERMGYSGRVVTGKTKKSERDGSIELFRYGSIRFLVSVDVLSEGYDEPRIDALIMLRPTKSAGKYVQQVGRGTRPIYAAGYNLETKDGRLAAIVAGPKRDFLVLDFAGNIEAHGPVDAIRVEKAKRGSSKSTVVTAPQKICPQCNAYVMIQIMTCACGYQWPRPEAKHSDTATDAPILSDGETKIAAHEINGITYVKYSKADGRPLMLVTYNCGLRTFTEYVPLEHGGELRSRAVEWWNARNFTRVPLVPRTVDAALEIVHTLRQPKRITISETGKYPEIIGIEL